MDAPKATLKAVPLGQEVNKPPAPPPPEPEPLAPVLDPPPPPPATTKYSTLILPGLSPVVPLGNITPSVFSEVKVSPGKCGIIS